MRRCPPRVAVVRVRRERGHLTDDTHDLLVLDVVAGVDGPALQRRVLLGVKSGEGVETREDNAHRVRVVGQSFDGGDDRDWERGVAHDGLFPLAELARVGEVAVDERERGLCLGKKCE